MPRRGMPNTRSPGSNRSRRQDERSLNNAGGGESCSVRNVGAILGEPERQHSLFSGAYLGLSGPRVARVLTSSLHCKILGEFWVDHITWILRSGLGVLELGAAASSRGQVVRLGIGIRAALWQPGRTFEPGGYWLNRHELSACRRETIWASCGCMLHDSAVETNEEATVAMRVPRSSVLWCSAASVLLLVLFTPCPAQEREVVATGAIPRFPDTQSNQGERARFPPNALQMARIIGVESDIEKLSSLAAAKGTSAAPGLSLEEISLHQQITEAVIAASLDVDSVSAEVDYEREQTVELRSLWRYKRDRAIGSTNLAVLAAGTGFGIVSGLLQFSKTTSSAGNAIGFAAGGISTLFSLRSFRQVHGGKRPAWVFPNMLAEFLGQPAEQHSHYPDEIRAYLNSAPQEAASQASRKEQMLEAWVAAGRIGPPDSPQWKQRIALLTSTNAADKELNIELMNEQGGNAG